MRTRSALIAALLLITIVGISSTYAVRARPALDAHFVTYSGAVLNGNWAADPHAGYCGAQWLPDVGGYTTIDGSCDNGNAGIALRDEAGASLPSSMYVESVSMNLSRIYSGMTLDVETSAGVFDLGVGAISDGFHSFETVNVNTVITNDIGIFWHLGQTCSFSWDPLQGSSDCPYIQSITVTWLDPTPTPGGATVITDTPWPTAVNSSTFSPTLTSFPAFTPTVIQTFVAPPLPTIGDLDVCSSDPFAPCGTMPYAMVYLPTLNLPSPSAWPTVDTPTPIPITITPLPTNTPTGTLPSPTPIYVGATITAYPSPAFDFNSIATQVGMTFGTLAPLAGSQISFNGTPSGMVDLAGQLGSGAGRAIGFINAIQGTDINTAGGLITAALLIVIFVVLVEVLVLILPFLLMIFRILLQAIGALKPF